MTSGALKPIPRGSAMPRAPAEGKRGFGGWETMLVPKGHVIQWVIFSLPLVDAAGMQH